jgi:glutathione synthase/RimK-type ligase-like ATP-grasp enzyme
MSRRPSAPCILVPGAGTGAGNSLIRSLRAGDRRFRVVGCHDDRFYLKKSVADTNYLLPPPRHAGYVASLGDAIRAGRVHLVIPNTDAAVRQISLIRDVLPCRVFLPSHAVLTLCADKYRLTARLAADGVPVPVTYPLRDRASVPAVFRRLRGGRVWCRLRTGGASRGAVPVSTAAQAIAWIAYWERMRGVPARAFTLAEYLPGRDFACQSLWRDGRLVLIKTVERLSYFGGGSQPSGVSSIAALAKTVTEPAVVDVCTAAIRALGPGISGAFSVDLKENARGVPCVTEINAGRFITMMNLFDFTGRHNMAATYVRLALGYPVAIDPAYDVDVDHYFVRDVDTPPAVFHADELFRGIRDARRVDGRHVTAKKEVTR